MSEFYWDEKFKKLYDKSVEVGDLDFTYNILTVLECLGLKDEYVAFRYEIKKKENRN